MKAAKPRQIPPGYKPTEGHSFALIAWAISLTAQVAKVHQAEGECDPQLYESLKALQLVYDRHARKASKSGDAGLLQKVLEPLPEYPKLTQ